MTSPKNIISGEIKRRERENLIGFIQMELEELSYEFLIGMEIKCSPVVRLMQKLQ